MASGMTSNKNLENPLSFTFPPEEKCSKFYKYVKVQDCIKILSEGTLWYSKPMNFNDPFDCYPYFPKKGRDKVMKRISKEHALERFTTKKRIRKNFSIMSQTGDGGMIHELISNNLAVTCFSTDYLSVPMWAHYADEHQGCVVEFSYDNNIINKIIEIDKDSPILIAYPVTYSDERPPLFDKDGNLHGLAIALSKSTQWAYEKEVRALSKKEGVHHFSRLQVTRVFTGVRISNEDRELVKNTIHNMNLELKNRCKMVELKMAFNTYKFVELG